MSGTEPVGRGSPEALNRRTAERLSRQRRRDTGPELALRRRLHARGLRFRVDFRPESALRIRGDLVFTRARLVVWIHGCFWHGCAEHGTLPRNNREFWSAKLEANRRRDARHIQELESLGWRCLQFWEHEDPDAVADVVEAAARAPQAERPRA